MARIAFAVSHYAALLVFALLAYHVGRTLTRRVRYDSIAEDLAFSTSLGLAALAYVVMGLGLLGLLFPGTVSVALVLCVVVTLPAWVGTVRRVKHAVPQMAAAGGLTRAALVALLTCAAVVLSMPLLAWPLYPPTAFDATMYHLAVAKIYTAAHGLVLTPDLRYPIFPQAPHMLFTLALLLYDDIAAQLTQMLALVLLSCALVAFARRHMSTRAGWLAAAVVLSNPLVLWLGSTAYVDMMLMLLTMLMIAAFWTWCRTSERSWLVIAGVCGGLALTVKTSAGFFILVLLLAALVSHSRTRLRDAGLFAATSLAAAAPWLLRSLYYTHNPVYPFLRSAFTRLFGPGVLNPADYAGLFEDFARYGAGRSWKALLMLPWNIAADPTAFGSWVPLSISLGLTLPVIAVGLFASVAVRWLVAIVLSFTLLWFVTAQELRYWLPALPLLGLAIGGSIDRITGVRARFLVPILVVVLVAPGWSYVRDRVGASGPIPVTSAERDAFLTAVLPSYEAYATLRTMGRQNYTAYAIDDENLKYYADGRVLGDFFGPARYGLIWRDLRDGEALYRTLKKMGVQYFIVNHQRRQIPLTRDDVFEARFRVLWSSSHVWLFELKE